MCVDITYNFGIQLLIVEPYGSDTDIYVWLIVYMYKLVSDIFVRVWKGDYVSMGLRSSNETTGSRIYLYLTSNPNPPPPTPCRHLLLCLVRVRVRVRKLYL